MELHADDLGRATYQERDRITEWLRTHDLYNRGVRMVKELADGRLLVTHYFDERGNAKVTKDAEGIGTVEEREMILDFPAANFPWPEFCTTEAAKRVK